MSRNLHHAILQLFALRIENFIICLQLLSPVVRVRVEFEDFANLQVKCFLDTIDRVSHVRKTVMQYFLGVTDVSYLLEQVGDLFDAHEVFLDEILADDSGHCIFVVLQFLREKWPLVQLISNHIEYFFLVEQAHHLGLAA